jgi:DNA-binding response OmpR family regulator
MHKAMKNQTQPPTRDRSAKPFSLRKRRILIVEDEEKVYEWLAETLDGEAFDAVWTRTAHESLRRSLDEPFDLVLLDLNISDMNGWKALDWFNKMHPFLPVVVLTDQPDQAQRAKALGADAGLKKPLNGPQLSDTVKKLLAESHSARMTRLTDPLYGLSYLH